MAPAPGRPHAKAYSFGSHSFVQFASPLAACCCVASPSGQLVGSLLRHAVPPPVELTQRRYNRAATQFPGAASAGSRSAGQTQAPSAALEPVSLEVAALDGVPPVLGDVGAPHAVSKAIGKNSRRRRLVPVTWTRSPSCFAATNTQFSRFVNGGQRDHPCSRVASARSPPAATSENLFLPVPPDPRAIGWKIVEIGGTR